MALDNFIPELWSAELLVNLKNSLVFGNPLVINRNYEGEVSRFGDTVRINSIGGVTVANYTKNANHVAPEVLSDSQMVLTIDQAKMFNFQIDDVDRAQQNPKLMSAAMREAAFALANEADTHIANLLDNGTPAGNTLTDVSYDNTFEDYYEAFVDLGVKLDENNAPTDGRWAIMRPSVIGVLRKDDRFVSFGTEANRAVAAGGTGVLGTIAGFNILVSNKVPNGNGGNPQVLAGHNMAATFADQIESLEAYRPELRFADAMKGLHVYGSKVIRPELLAKVEVDVTA
jgi:N4-gp56 family major capsid protein